MRLIKEFRELTSILFLFGSLIVHAQADSLINILYRLPGNNLKEIEELNRYSEKLIEINPSLSEFFANKALSKSIKLNIQEEEARSYMNLATALRIKSELIKSLDFSLKGLRIYEQIGDSPKISQALNSVGRTLSDLERYGEARKYYRQGMKINNNKDLKMKGNFINNIGSTWQYEDEMDSAYYYFNKAFEIRKEINDKVGLATSYGNIGIIFKAKSNTSKAIEYYNKSIELKMELGLLMGLAYSYINLGNLYRDIYQFEESRKHYNQALVYSDSASAKGVQSYIYSRLAKIERQAENEHLADKYHIKALELQVQVLRERQESTIEQTKLIYELKKIEDELLIENQKIEMLESRNLLQKFQLAFLILLFIIVIVLFLLYRNKSESKKEILKRELKNRENELSIHTINLIQKQEIIGTIKSIIKNIKKQILPNNANKSILEIDLLLDNEIRNDRQWLDFKIYFERIHQNFFHNLSKKYPDLTTSDLRLAALIKLRLSIKETASALGVESDSVKTARYRFRKKLNLSRDENLTLFLDQF